MKFDEISKLMSEAGVDVCPICGMPFKRYHRRQKTCGNDECKHEYHKQYMRSWRKKRLEEHPEEFRAYRAKAMRNYRAKQRALELREEELDEVMQRWRKQSELDRITAEHGMEYGSLSAQKVLAGVEKIDVNIERRKQ